MTGFAHPEFLVDGEWLQHHLHDPGVVVLDCTTHLVPVPGENYQIVSGLADFTRGHIPGAQHVDIQADLSDPTPALRFMLPTADFFAATMSRLGIADGTRVVLYSTANMWWASRVWWLLRVFGHDHAAVLDGGFQAWTADARPIETGPATPRPATWFTARPPLPLMADRTDVLAAIGDDAVCTLNALRPEQHAGTDASPYGRPGHIAGSVNLPAAHLVDPATHRLLPAERLREKFAAIGALDRPVITYCGGGIAASADALALVMLGHENVRIYDASLSEWARDPSLPMATG